MNKRGKSAINGCLRKNPINPLYFTDNSGKAIFLTGSHTWAVMQDMWTEKEGRNDLNFDEYLDFMEENNHNFLRFWTFGASPEGGSWTEEIVYHDPLPYIRSGQGTALDGKSKFDLDKWNDEYFERLRERAIKAGNRGIYVSIMFFERCSIMWGKGRSNPLVTHPFHIENNINGLNGIPSLEEQGTIYSLKIQEVVDYQKAYIRKTIDTVNDLDNILFEIINEAPWYPETVVWHYHMVDYVHQYEKTKPKQHPVGMTAEGEPQNNKILFDSNADWISPGSGLASLYRYNPPESDGRKVIISDTDHLWGFGGNYKWVWKSFIRGLNPIFMDPWQPLPGPLRKDYFGIVYNSRDYRDWPLIRKSMGYALDYARRIDLNRMQPYSKLASSGYCLAIPGEQYLVYIPEGDGVGMNLLPGKKLYNVEWFNPTTGETIIDKPVEARPYPGNVFTVPFSSDAVLYIYAAK